MKSKLLVDKIALIIGGSQGIGLATATLFAEEGATVIITGRNRASLETAAANIQGNVQFIQSDISNKEDRDLLFSTVAQEHKKIDVAFINAGMAEGAPLDLVTEESFDEHLVVFEGQTHNYVVYEELSKDGVFVPELIGHIVTGQTIETMVGADGFGLIVNAFNVNE